MTANKPMTATTCELSSITNNTGGTIMIAKFENRDDNLLVPGGDTRRKTVWLPHVSNEDEFVKKTLAVLSLPDQRVLGFLWNNGSDGIIRFSPKGYDPRASALPGRNTEKITLTVQKDGSLRGD